MSLIFKVGEHEEMHPVPRNFPRCGDWKPTNRQEDSSKIDIISTTERMESNNEESNADAMTQFFRYLTYFELFVKKLQSSSASNLNVTSLLLVICLLSTVIRIQPL